MSFSLSLSLSICVCYRFWTFNAKPFSINTHIYKFTKRVDSTQIYIIRLVEYYVLNVIAVYLIQTKYIQTKQKNNKWTKTNPWDKKMDSNNVYFFSLLTLSTSRHISYRMKNICMDRGKDSNSICIVDKRKSSYTWPLYLIEIFRRNLCALVSVFYFCFI